MKIGIVSCGGSNVTSVVNALRKVGYDSNLLNNPDLKTDFLIMPGVGAFGAAVNRLHNSGFPEYICEHVRAGKPVIGICLGMQILFESSEEDEAAVGLGIFEGRFSRLLEHPSPDLRSPPNIGYNYVRFTTHGGNNMRGNFSGLDGHFYFLHSYAMKQLNISIDICGISQFNDENFIPFVLRDNVCGIQFHPERSGMPGLNLLARTIEALK